MRAFRSWEQYTPGTNLRAWLLRIVHNLAVDAGRKRQRTPQMEPVEESDYYLYQRMGGTSTPEEADSVVERLSQGGVVSALAALPQPYRDAVVLVDLADFSYQDAADILDVPIGTIMSACIADGACSRPNSPRRSRTPRRPQHREHYDWSLCTCRESHAGISRQAALPR